MSEISNIGTMVQTIKSAILQSQLRIAQGGNAEQLSLYFCVGHYISQNTRTRRWGDSAIDEISTSLQKEMPGLRGFSARNIRYMRQFYEDWSCVFIFAATAAKNQDTHDSLRILQPIAAKSELDLPTFVSISFTHHVEIMTRVKELAARIFYIRQASLQQWKKETLRHAIREDLYHHQGALPNNFVATIPDAQKSLRAIMMFKDEYLLDFMNTEELDVRDSEDVDERVLEKQIIQNVKNFIMTFGKDFTFVGNQYHLEKFGHDLYPDLLFYNRELACLVAVELKKGDFKPAYLGQLSAYLRVLDDEVKKPFENPSIGIVLCRSADKTFVEYLIQGYENPMGVATYKTKEDVMKLLPSREELQRLIEKE